MTKTPDNDPIAQPEDSLPTQRRKRRAGGGIVTFFIIFAIGAFSLYLFIVFYGAIAGSQ
ncbi:hypothetical protein J2858_002762 [Neorhizobium galegae]|uniref:hypothetical protein n=1 Tax=Rhizobium/Agrobacterium group TaxID=227290 RepID=UPI001AE987C7|nr:hypothetical protein [Neorhizobium galegae]MBP2549829.1 hypothetical protein [Neorhizobium galegae]